MTTHDDQIRTLLATYEQSLNTSDAALAASCYTQDGIFMPTLPTATGGDMEGAYRQIFDAIRLDVTFTIDELEITSDTAAYALTRSNGTQTVLAAAGNDVMTCRSTVVARRHSVPVAEWVRWGCAPRARRRGGGWSNSSRCIGRRSSPDQTIFEPSRPQY